MRRRWASTTTPSRASRHYASPRATRSPSGDGTHSGRPAIMQSIRLDRLKRESAAGYALYSTFHRTAAIAPLSAAADNPETEKP